MPTAQRSRLALGPSLTVIAIVLVGCAGLAASSTAVPTPIPPPELSALPTSARTRCPTPSSGGVMLWEHAAREPSEIGDPIADRGAEVGQVGWCEAIIVSSYEWSDFDKSFWVLIDNSRGQRGWLSIDNLEFAR